MFAHSPFRFSISTCAEKASFAYHPLPFLYRRASGSVVDWWVSLQRFSPWKSTVGLNGSSGGRRSLDFSFLDRKLFIDAHASMSVPSTVKWSADISLAPLACDTTSSKKRLATSASINRSLFLAKTEGLKTSSSIDMSRNQRKRRLYSSCSQSWRSLRMV